MIKHVVLVMLCAMSASCGTIEVSRPNYILKACSNEVCKPIDVLDSLSHCMDLRDQIKAEYKVAAICQGLRN